MNFIESLSSYTSQSLSLCFHCHKCTGGCPVAGDMRYGPDRILRLVQLGERQRVLESADIWLCASCETCGTRCPNDIDIARVMDGLRQEAILTGIRPAEPDAIKFHRLFLFFVERLGRVHEAGMLAAYKLWSGHLMADMDSGVVMFAKGKVPLAPKIIKNRQAVQNLFKQSAIGEKTEQEQVRP